MSHRFRLTILILLVAGAFSFLGFNLFHLQIKQGEYYSAKAESRYKLAGVLEPSRGAIYFVDKNANKIPAALNKSYSVIFAVPREIDDVEELVKSLSSVLEIREDELREKLQTKDLYELLLKKASDEQVGKVRALELKGIYIDDQEFRFYPFNNLTAQVLGFVGPDEEDNAIGKYGVEFFYDGKLAGAFGTIKDNKNY